MPLLSPKAPVLLLALGSGIGLIALATVVSHEPKLAPGPLKSSAPAATVVAEPAAPRVTVKKTTPHHHEVKELVQESAVVRAVSLHGDEPALDRTVTVANGEDPRRAALRATMKGLGYDDVRVLATSVERGVLTADVSPTLFRRGFGTMAESNFIHGLQMTLAQFPEIKSFRLRCDGEVVTTLGHFEMTEPVPVREVPDAPKP
ncbi:MAG: hypothetical protein C4320_01440 [Armatimonadota bacterium]